MKTPYRIEPLVEEGLVDEVLRQLMSGKEATVYVVRCGAEIRCAKVYKDSTQRSFRGGSAYREGRTTKNSRDSRARAKSSRYGRRMEEASWHSAELDALRRLAAAGVRVPVPHGCFEGVLLMELVTDAGGNAAPRLNDVELDEATALEYHGLLIEQVVRMLCAGLIHGDLSEYNVLLGADGPVIIDVPQAVSAADHSEAAALLQRDVSNLAAYFGRFAPQLLGTEFGREIWRLYEAGELVPGIGLTGRAPEATSPADAQSVLNEIALARRERRDDARSRAGEAV